VDEIKGGSKRDSIFVLDCSGFGGDGMDTMRGFAANWYFCK